MMKCFYTGINLNANEAYLLDLARARIILRELKNRTDAIEKLIRELGETDKVEVFIQQKGKKVIQHRRRLIYEELASAFLLATEGKQDPFMMIREISSRGDKAIPALREFLYLGDELIPSSYRVS